MIRNTDVKPSERRYASSLRDEQVEATRIRILEALVRTMASGVAGLSVPAVAREAQVSIPTIYRHFGSKQGLIEALNPYVIAKGGLVPEQMPQSVDELGPIVRALFRNLDRMDLTLRAAMASQLGQELRTAMLPKRRAMTREFVARLAPDLPDADLGRLADLALILMSSAAFRAYKDYLGLGPDAAAALVGWAIRTLIGGARPAERGSA
jgi:AcrR family transcriptional regulator